MNIDQRLAKENEEIKQLEATLERVLAVLEATKDRHKGELKESVTEIEEVQVKLSARKTYRQFMEDVIEEREEQAEDMREAFLSMRSDLASGGKTYPESVDLLGITLGLDEPGEATSNGTAAA